MKKEVLIFFLIFTILNPSTLALSEKFNDWVYDSDTLVLDSKTFGFKVSSNAENVVVTYSSSNRIIRSGNCDSYNNIKVCVDELFVDTSYNDKRAKVRIFYFEPNITIERSADKLEVFAGEEVNFQVNIKNNGDLDAKNFIYVDYFPEDALITSVSGKCAKRDDNSIIYETNLESGASFNCAYKVITQKESDLKLKAQIDYYDGTADKRIYSNITRIISESLFDVDAYQGKSRANSTNRTIIYTVLSDADIEVGETFYLYLNLTNLAGDKLYFENFSITFPEEFKIEKSSVNLNGKSYLWKGSIDENLTKSLFFTLKAEAGGNFEIKYETSITKDKQTLKGIGGKIDFEIIDGGIELKSNLDNITAFDATKEMFVTFSGKNSYNHTTIKTGSATFTSCMTPNASISITTIPPNKSALIYQTAVVLKNVTSSKSCKFTLITSYTTEYGVKKTEKKEWQATITPLKEIEIKKTFSNTDIHEGDKVNVTVTLKNTRNTPLYDVSLEEIFPEGLSRYGKTKTRADIIYAGETISAYNYTITAPQVKNISDILIKSRLSYLEKHSETELNKDAVISINELNITIKPKKISLDISKSADYTSIDLGELVNVVYTIENEDDETAYNLKFIFSQSRYVDLINNYEYSLSRIEPGEVMTFKQETARPKKSGRYDIGSSIMFFEDVDGNSFNYSIESLSINAEDRALKGPVILLSKTLSSARITEGDIINVTLSIDNIGDEDADLRIIDGMREMQVLSPAKRQQNITYSIKPTSGSVKSADVFAYYNFLGKEYRAFAQGQLFVVDAKPDAPKKAVSMTASQNAPDTNNNITNQDLSDADINSDKNFFKNLWIKIKSAIGMK